MGLSSPMLSWAGGQAGWEGNAQAARKPSLSSPLAAAQDGQSTDALKAWLDCQSILGPGATDVTGPRSRISKDQRRPRET